MTHRSTQSGFTLIELLVAIGIAVLMLGMINLIFNEVVTAVSSGISTSRIINNARTASEQFDRDARGMVGPSDSGALIILNHELVDNPADPNDMTMQDTRFGGLFTPVTPYRSDQLTFFYDNRGTGDIDILDGLAPAGNNTFVPDRRTRAARFVRIWYGHVVRTDRGQDGASSSPLGSGANRRADQWVLGRHALFLIDSNPPNVYAASAFSNASVPNNYAGDINGSIPLFLQWALTDVAHYSFDTNTPNPAANGHVIGLLNGNGSATGSGTEASILDPDDTADEYRLNAFAIAFGFNRLRVNPTPEKSTFLASQIAQMHPFFVDQVSEFVVQFAADAVDNGGDNLPDGQPDLALDGSIIWYDMDNLPPYELGAGQMYDGLTNPRHPVAITYANRGFVWRHDEPQTWPYLIRIRYRLHDNNGDLTDVNEFRITTNSGAPEGLDNDGNGVIDDDSDAVEVGKWFEVIIPVNRPRP